MRCRELARHELVALRVQGAPLRVTDDHVAAADIDEHRRRDFPGLRARLFRADVLAAETDGAAFEPMADFGEIDEGRANDDLGDGPEPAPPAIRPSTSRAVPQHGCRTSSSSGDRAACG